MNIKTKTTAKALKVTLLLLNPIRGRKKQGSLVTFIKCKRYSKYKTALQSYQAHRDFETLVIEVHIIRQGDGLTAVVNQLSASSYLEFYKHFPIVLPYGLLKNVTFSIQTWNKNMSSRLFSTKNIPIRMSKFFLPSFQTALLRDIFQYSGEK